MYFEAVVPELIDLRYQQGYRFSNSADKSGNFSLKLAFRSSSNIYKVVGIVVKVLQVRTLMAAYRPADFWFLD